MTQPPVPSFDHIFIVIMENHGYDEIIGNAEAPYINQLATRYGLATNYVSVAHPSLPNYLALTGGDTFGVTTDCTDCFQQAPNLAVDRINPSGRTWRAYMESMPSPGYLGDAYPYMQKHDPFVYYDDLRTDPAQLANVVPFDQLATDLATAQTTPAFGWITPNMLHDMHDGTIAQGDTWLSSQIPALLSSPAWTQQRSLLVITWDEDDNAPGNQVATLVIADGRADRIPVRGGLQPLLASADYRTRLGTCPADGQRCRRHGDERLLRQRLTAKYSASSLPGSQRPSTGDAAGGGCGCQMLQSAWVGDRRAARMAGSSPARAPMMMAAPRPPAQACDGMTRSSGGRGRRWRWRPRRWRCSGAAAGQRQQDGLGQELDADLASGGAQGAA